MSIVNINFDGQKNEPAVVNFWFSESRAYCPVLKKLKGCVNAFSFTEFQYKRSNALAEGTLNPNPR